MNYDRKNILLVEDEILIAMSQKMSLNNYGYMVHHVSSGEKALEFIINNQSVDLILMDINLGHGIDGTIAAEKILSNKDIPVVFLSAHTEPEIVKKTEKITSYGYVVKNNDIVVLDASIKMALKLFQAKKEQREMETALRHKNEEFQMLFRNSPYGIIICELITNADNHPVDFVHIQGNLSTEKQTGLIVDELVGKKASELVTPEVLEDLLEKYDKVIKKNQTLTYEQYFDVYKRYLSVTAYPLFQKRFVLNFIDITDRKCAEKIIKLQLSEKEILLYEVHHRVKNNIANIESFLALQAECSENNEVKNCLYDAISRVKGMRILYDKLLLSKDHSEISLKNYIETLIASLSSVFIYNDNIKIEKKIEELQIDSKRAVSIGIIINEIMTNAFKYAFTENNKGKIFISIQQKNSDLVILIQDNGIGIDEKILNNYKHGLGLVIVKMLVEQLEGTFDQKNENGLKIEITFKI